MLNKQDAKYLENKILKLKVRETKGQGSYFQCINLVQLFCQ